MPKVHSHYENLKVARDATPDAIRAAYRGLTRQHHPDRNPDDADAQRIMSVVNVAYAVLSDPAKRLEHDQWIRQAESPHARPLHTPHTLHAPFSGPASADEEAAYRSAAAQVRWARAADRLKLHVRRHPWRYVAPASLLLVGVVAGLHALVDPDIVIGHIAAAPVLPKSPGYRRPASAPNAQPWPQRSGYVEGYPVLNTGGLSDVTIDNAANDADVFVRLVTLDGPNALPVRSVYVAAHARLKIDSLSIGTYDLRYRNLATGGLLRSPPFILEEVSGTQRNTTALKLNGNGAPNVQAYLLSESDLF